MRFNRKKFNKILDEILDGNYDRVVIWRSTFGWNVPLFQRPQHISKCLAENKCLVFYEVTTMTDKVKNISKVEDNLYLVNLNNIEMSKLLYARLNKINKPKYIQIYSTNGTMPQSDLEKYIKNDYKIIYEYIDDLSPALSGTKELPQNLIDKYNYALKDKENVFIAVTADELEEDILSKRGNEKLVFSCNGVDFEHFQTFAEVFEFEKEFTNIISDQKPIIGYYGALASWFDYELVKYLAKSRPEYNIVLIGIKYDDTFDKENLSEFSNVHFIGARDYSVLKYYAREFDVSTIPFIINEITEATSPVKLFEYMALSRPIVTTNMKECKKYDSVFKSETKEQFVELIDEGVKINNTKNENKEYFDMLKKEALENTWDKKAKVIVELLKRYE